MMEIETKITLCTPKQKCMVLILSVVIGILGCLAAYIFEGLIALIHNLSFYGKFDFVYHNTQQTQESIFGIGIILPLMIGAIAVRWLLSKYAYDEQGLSVSEIMYAIHYRSSEIRPRVTVAKILSSSITIGTGGSVGREGPFIQIGASLSALISNFATLPPYCRGVLIAAGSAAIVSSTFNAPLAGIAFAVEFLLLSFNYLGLLSVSIASLTAILLKSYIVDITPIFLISDLDVSQSIASEFLLFVPLGVLCGLISWAFIQAVYAAQDGFGHLIGNQYLRHMLGMTLVGITIYAFMYLTGNYYVNGIGFATIQDCLLFVINNPWLLVAIFAGKFMTTCLTLGSGASGGIFSPAAYLGATFGTLCCIILPLCFPSLTFNPVLLILSGIAATLAATTGAILTAILLVIEMTWYLDSILPLIITAVTAFIVRKLLCTDSIYTLRFKRAGISLPQWI